MIHLHSSLDVTFHLDIILLGSIGFHIYMSWKDTLDSRRILQYLLRYHASIFFDSIIYFDRRSSLKFKATYVNYNDTVFNYLAVCINFSILIRRSSLKFKATDVS